MQLLWSSNFNFTNKASAKAAHKMLTKLTLVVIYTFEIGAGHYYVTKFRIILGYSVNTMAHTVIFVTIK
jgi:hypothetical protein